MLQRVQRPDEDRVLYNSFDGRYSDSPRAIYEHLTGAGDRRHAWVASPGAELPPSARGVELYGLAFLRELGRCGHLVSNVPMPRNLRMRRGQTYLQTWHGTPLKRIGFDNDQWRSNPSGFGEMSRDSVRWDCLLSQNPFSTEIFRRAFRFEGEILESGYPRNDVLHSLQREELRARVRAELGAAAGVKVILYAPTWRDNLVGEHGDVGFALQLDVDRLTAELGDDHLLLIRTHHLVGSRLGALGERARDVSAYPDIRDLYLAADVLITDYSSAMFDFAVTGKPLVFFVYDLAAYRDEVRGFYFELDEVAPGPLCATGDEVIDALRDLDAISTAYTERYGAFQARFCPFDDGYASQRVVERVFGH
ncbi:MAG: CDP-glycerol glycerophosphotransferase [Solirubrobacterales bacterium]|nr:CDP-glycerol glycerophosphotransferase [Solirubrobacterales bacterium]